MASNVSRGRGYSGKNKDIVRAPANISDNERLNTSSQRNPHFPSKYENVLPDANRSSQRQNDVYMSSFQMPQIIDASRQSQYKVDEHEYNVKPGATNVHILNESDNHNEGVKYSHEFLRTISVSDENRQSVLFIDDQHINLLQQVNLLSPEDDGILLNKKLLYIGEILTKQYKDSSSLREALDAVASAAILDSRISAKVSQLCCSLWFNSCQLFGNKLHNIFIETLTNKIDGLEVSLEGADQYLVNTVTLLSNIFTETKTLNPDELKIIAHLIVQVSIGLLECHTPLALKTLNIQLMQHGRKLYQSVPGKVESLSISARKLLIAKQPPPPSCRIWLTLLADQCLCRLEPLPKYLEDFYSVHLDESQISLEEKLNNKSDQGNYTDYKNANSRFAEKCRKSDSSDIYSVHSGGDKGADCDQKFNDEVFDERNVQHDSSFDSSGMSDANNSENYDCHNSNMSQSLERKPRPILGAGARFGPVVNKNHFEFSEPPPSLNNVNINQTDEDNVPVFCPSVPPPSFIPKQKTSASQDSADYWNTPPPPLPNNKKKDVVPTMQTSSVLSKRLDLNSWREENIEPVHDTTENVENVIVENFNSTEHESDTSKLLLDKIKSSNRGLDQTNPNISKPSNVSQRSDKKRTGQIFYERKQGGNYNKDTAPIEHWDDPQTNDNDSYSTGADKGRFKINSDKNQFAGSPRTPRDFGKSKSNIDSRLNKDAVRQESSESTESLATRWEHDERNRKPKEQRVHKGERSDRIDKSRDKKTFEDERESGMDDRKPRNMGRRDQRGGGGRNNNSNRATMEVHRGASYWTHDDRCDKEYVD